MSFVEKKVVRTSRAIEMVTTRLKNTLEHNFVRSHYSPDGIR